MAQVPDSFLTTSSRLTGFSTTELQGSGMSQSYWDTLVTHLGEEQSQKLTDELAKPTDDLKLFLQKAQKSPATRTFMVIVAYLWYTGAWPLLPKDLQDQIPVGARSPFVVSPESTRQGLVWYAFGGHAPGAHPQGHGSWNRDPWPIPREGELKLDIGS